MLKGAISSTKGQHVILANFQQQRCSWLGPTLESTGCDSRVTLIFPIFNQLEKLSDRQLTQAGQPYSREQDYAAHLQGDLLGRRVSLCL